MHPQREAALMDPISVLLVEDNTDLRENFCEMIDSTPMLRLFGAAADGAQARALLAERGPDVALIDLGLPDGNGIDLIREIAARYSGTDILVVSVFGDEASVIGALEAGARGYLLKDMQTEEFVRHIKEVRSGGSPLSAQIARHLLRRYVPTRFDPVTEPGQTLTEREIETLRLIAKGFSLNEVARLLKLSPHTVGSHVKKLYSKLAVHSKNEAVFEATRKGLL
jgi:DNA-binding NarL/FixJ family response regulator